MSRFLTLILNYKASCFPSLPAIQGSRAMSSMEALPQSHKQSHDSLVSHPRHGSQHCTNAFLEHLPPVPFPFPFKASISADHFHAYWSHPPRAKETQWLYFSFGEYTYTSWWQLLCHCLMLPFNSHCFVQHSIRQKRSDYAVMYKKETLYLNSVTF